MDVHYIEWHIVPFRRDAFLEIWRPALDRALAYGAKAAFLTRNEDDTLHIRQVTVWETAPTTSAGGSPTRSRPSARRRSSYYHKPVDQHWHARIADAAIATNGAVPED